MSLRVLEDNVLESLICSKCKKYSSVKPTTVDLHGSLICGRCYDHEPITTSTTEKVPINMLSYFMSDYVLFKCINQYDGCTEVLTVDQTAFHEKTCLSKKYICPFCLHRSSAIPSYEFASHMKTTHEKSCLSSNIFTVELVDSVKHEYFYKKGDYLFFIHQWFQKNENCLVLNATFLGGDKNNLPEIHQKYYLVNSSQLPTVKSQKCFHLVDLCENGSNKLVNFKVNNKNLKFATIIFEFEIPLSEHFAINMDSSLSQTLLCRDIRNEFENLLKKSVKHSMQICASSQCEYAKILNIDHPEGKKLTKLSLNSTKTKFHIEVLDEHSEIQIKSVCFHCILCKCTYSIVNNYQSLYVIKTKNAMQYIVCFYCMDILEPYIKIENISSLLSEDQFKSVKFSHKKNITITFLLLKMLKFLAVCSKLIFAEVVLVSLQRILIH